ncbi:MAG: hypothetical protein VB086_04075 [Clostridiaceae bacterium]|nr:hypothetical protein [Clostridiaceae bacterium]
MKKNLLLAVGLLLFCAACSVEAETPDALSLEERALAGEAVPITESCAVDLDGDGTRETVDFGGWTLEPDGFMSQETWLRVGESEHSVNVVAVGDLYLFTPDGSALLLAMRDEWYEYLYEYQDGTLTEILPQGGNPLLHEWISGYDAGTGCVCTRAIWTRVEANWVNLEYRWQDHMLHLVEQEFYGYIQSGNSDQNRVLARSFHFYTKPSRDSESVLFPSGTEILLLGQQGDEWAKLKIISTGESYWINSVETSCYDADGTEIDSVQLFEGVELIP